MARSTCWMDLSVGGRPEGRVTFALYDGQAPRTCANFRALCAGDKGLGKTTKKPLTYKHSTFHRVIPGFMIQGGDFSMHNGTGGESIYGGKFADEAFHFKHTRAGLLSMANAGPDTNGSQFFVTCGPTPHLDGKHVVFGEVNSGMEVIRAVEKVDTYLKDAPAAAQKVRIDGCGVREVGSDRDARDVSKAEARAAKKRKKQEKKERKSAKKKKKDKKKKDKAKKKKKKKKKAREPSPAAAGRRRAGSDAPPPRAEPPARYYPPSREADRRDALRRSRSRSPPRRRSDASPPRRRPPSRSRSRSPPRRRRSDSFGRDAPRRSRSRSPPRRRSDASPPRRRPPSRSRSPPRRRSSPPRRYRSRSPPRRSRSPPRRRDPPPRRSRSPPRRSPPRRPNRSPSSSSSSSSSS